MPRKRLIACVLYCSSLSVFSALIHASDKQGGALVDVAVITVEASKPQRLVSIGGTVVAERSVSLDAQLPGRVKFIAGKEGDRFEEGQALLKLDDAGLLAKRAAARAQRDSAVASLRNAGVQLDREIVSPSTVAKTPGGMGMPSMIDQAFTNPMQSVMGMRQPAAERHSQVYARRTAVDQARNALTQAEASIRQIDAKLRDSVSKAPFAGSIIHKKVEVGDTVQPGQPLLDFADIDSLQIQVDVPARLRPGLKEDMPLLVRLDGVARPVTVRVARIFPVADTQRHTVRVKLDVPSGTPAAAGMYATVMLPDPSQSSRTTIVIPNSAVVHKGGLPLVYVVSPDHRVDLRLVRLGDPLGPEQVSILSGLQAGAQVVVQPPPGLRSGQAVTVHSAH